MAKRRRGSCSKSTPSTTEESKATYKTLSTTASGFRARVLKNGIILDPDSKPPANLADLRARLNRDGGKKTMTTKSAYEDYVTIVQQTAGEQDLVVRTSHRLLKEFNDKSYQPHFNQTFTALEKDVGFNNGLSPARPDFVEGFGPEQFRPFPVAQKLHGKAVLTNEGENSITLPHLAGEWKRPNDGLALAGLQSAYYGAILVYARKQALEYLGDPDPLGNAFVCTFATNGKSINFFAHYAAPSKINKKKMEYHQYLIRSLVLTTSYEDFKDARRQLQNLQDFAREQSVALKTRLIDYWRLKCDPGV
ncbi:hypothetical protein QQZ08_010478 [Neonectria magnoliae]|uniref:DUF7924 domain-containing protein n=1 Tax=Neonectria magnoliae TaxID=2732573 RepID=A0ABR1HGF6_9HYPO